MVSIVRTNTMRAKGCEKRGTLVRESVFVLFALTLLMVSLPFVLLWQMMRGVYRYATLWGAVLLAHTSANTQEHTHSSNCPHSSWA